MGKVINELTDMRYLKWSYNRHSSGTAGSFLKSYKILGKQKIYYKLSNYNAAEGIVGHECVNEIVACRLMEKLNMEHLDYDLIHALVQIEGKEYETYLCRSADFKNPGEGKIAFDTFFELNREEAETPIEMMERFGWREYLNNILFLDYIILNRDRHGANLEVLKDRVRKSYRMSPIFDNGLSLLFNCRTEEEIFSFDVMEDKKIQNFFGAPSAETNLELISPGFNPLTPVFNDAMYSFLLDDLEGIMGRIWCGKVFEMISARYGKYESLRTVR